MMEDEMVGWHQQLHGDEFEQTPGDNEGQRSLVCCISWGHKESDMTVTEQQLCFLVSKLLLDLEDVVQYICCLTDPKRRQHEKD